MKAIISREYVREQKEYSCIFRVEQLKQHASAKWQGPFFYRKMGNPNIVQRYLLQRKGDGTTN